MEECMLEEDVEQKMEALRQPGKYSSTDKQMKLDCKNKKRERNWPW